MPNRLPEIPVPPRLGGQPFDERGYLVPWFVDYVDGKPDFRTMDARKWRQAVMQRLCWMCGGVLGVHKVFVAGPMCGINRTSSEPPNHRDCAEYAVRACPFLTRPDMRRNIVNLPADAEEIGGHGLSRNPGVTMLWTTPEFDLFSDFNNKPLIRMGRPTSVAFWAEGRAATVEEIRRSVVTGLPLLQAAADLQGGEAPAMFIKTIEGAKRLYPAGVFD